LLLEYIHSGEINIGTDGVLVSSPLGSCVAIILYDSTRRIGGMAHVMLPGKSSKNHLNKNRYTVDAINSLLNKFYEFGTQNSDIQSCLIGGANVLKKKNDTIANEVIDSVKKTISEKKIVIRASSLRGFERRSVILNIKSGTVFYTIGGSKEKLLWDFLNVTSNDIIPIEKK
jgi:chemotaxis protein CheD